MPGAALARFSCVPQGTLPLPERSTTLKVNTEIERGFGIQPMPMSNQCQEVIQSACETAGIETLAMHSGAFHDTMHIADVTEVGLLFAPSQNGISHNPREWTDWTDCSIAT